MIETQTPETQPVLTPEQRASWERDGYLILRGFVPPEEAEMMNEHFMAIHAQGAPGYYEPPALEECNGDILRHYTRVMHPHRFDELSKEHMLDARLRLVLRELFGDEPLAAQSMMYFKPPGARGQALHQDNFYLRVNPGTCVAAWLALDAADEENGGMFIVPGSHTGPVQCPHAADVNKSFTTEEVDIPEGLKAVPAPLQAGDMLFFNGSVIHGSYPNSSEDRFRRAFICHYIPAGASEMAHYYYPLHDFEGEKVERGWAEGGGICGTEEWTKLEAARAHQADWSPIQ